MVEGGLISVRGRQQPTTDPKINASLRFRNPSQTEIVEAVVADVLAGRAVVAVRGEPGVGKTTQMRVIASKLGIRQRMVVMTRAGSVTPSKVLRLIAEAVGMPEAANLAPDQLLEALQARQHPERLVLLVDDVQDLPPAMFRYLGLLIELFDPRPIKLQLVLFGPIGQWPGLHGPDLELMRQATFSRHIIYAPTHPAHAPVEQAPVRPARFGSSPARLSGPLLDPNGKWSRRASIAALCVLFVTGATVTFLVNEAETPGRPPIRATERQSPAPPSIPSQTLVPATVVAPPAQPATPELPSKPVETEEATAPNPPFETPPESLTTQTQTAQDRSVRPEKDISPARSGGPGLVLVAGAGDDLPNLYARVYRGLEPPPYRQVVAANRMPLKPGALVVFPEPPAGWPAH